MNSKFYLCPEKNRATLYLLPNTLGVSIIFWFEHVGFGKDVVRLHYRQCVAIHRPGHGH